MSDIVKFPAEVLKCIEAADSLLAEHHSVALDTKRHVTQALMQAELIEQLNAALTDAVVQRLSVLKDTSLGFRTDEATRIKHGEKPYTIQEIRRCMIEGALKGAAIINNEFNIISGGTYLAKNFFGRKLREMEGLTDLVITYGTPRFREGGACVDVTASWTYKGAKASMDCTGNNAIPVRLNQGQGADAAFGKAERKIKARIYERITGSAHDDGEVDDSDLRTVSGVVVEPTTVQSRTQVLTEALEKKAGTAQGTAARLPSSPQATEAPHNTPQPAPVPASAPAAAPESVEPKAKGRPPKDKSDAAAPAAAPPTQVLSRPMDEPASEFEEGEETISVESVRRRTRREKGEDLVFYVIINDHATEYITNTLELAQVAKLGKEKHQCVLLKYHEHKQQTGPLYWIVSVTILESAKLEAPVASPPETAAQPPSDAEVTA